MKSQLLSMPTPPRVRGVPSPSEERLPEGHTAKIYVPRIPKRGHYSEDARLERLSWARRQTGAHLLHLQTTSLSPDRLSGNIENLIGGVEVPVGLAGPLLIHGGQAQGLFYAPFATTEGALVASACRGSRAISNSGGVHVRILGQRMTRVPLFVFSDLAQACRFVDWLRVEERRIRAQTRQVSSHAELVDLRPHQIGSLVHLRFVYETGDAAGQNMTTACTWKACRWILEELEKNEGITCHDFFIDGNLSSDKKAAFQSFAEGRGMRVTAECRIQADVLQHTLKVSPQQLERLHQFCLQGSVAAGALGANINVANVIAAVFTATGQDIACVHESSLAQLSLRAEGDEAIVASLLLPGLIVGTVGGGTDLPTQNDLLDLMGCAGPGSIARLAEIITGFCLALDLSTLSAVASGQFASAHEKLGRNRPVRWFSQEDLHPEFFQEGVRRVQEDLGLQVESVSPIETEVGSSIITELTARKIRKLIGLFPRQLDYRDSEGRPGRCQVMVKVKPLDDEVILMLQTVAGMCDPELSKLVERHRERIGLRKCHLRELAVASQEDPRFVAHAPQVYVAHREPSREAFVLVMELLENVEQIRVPDTSSGWAPQHIEAAISGIAQIHSIWLGREAELISQSWLGPVPTTESMLQMNDLLRAMADHGAREFSWYSSSHLETQHRLLDSLDRWWPEIEALPRTLIHNDFNPRNIFFRTEEGAPPRLCAYDWELATLHLPQHDLAELLAFVLPPGFTRRDVDRYLELHRSCLEEASGTSFDQQAWRRGFQLALADFGVNRLAFYTMAHTVRQYPFMQRVFHTFHRLLELEA